jgi:hypothetical protein
MSSNPIRAGSVGNLFVNSSPPLLAAAADDDDDGAAVQANGQTAHWLHGENHS